MSVPKYTLAQVLQDKWWIGAVALGVSLVATPIARYAAYKLKIVDKPDDLLKPHARPIAYLGGLAMCIGLLAGIVGYFTIMPRGAAHWRELGNSLGAMDLRALLSNPIWNLLGIATGSIVITIVGLLDDLRSLKPKTKILGQVLAAGILLIGGVGARMAVVIPIVRELPFWLLVPLSAVLCVCMVIATCNATNLLDGLDGLCGGVTGIIALGYLALAVWLATWGHQAYLDSDPLRVGICLAMAGAVLGFLPYNIPPASIFMGDAGSMLLGFFVAAMMALFCQEGNPRWFIAACAVFALPILDTALAVVRRALAGVHIMTGDRSHLYDQLVDRGMSVKQVVALFYVLAALAAVIGVAVAMHLRTRYALVLYAVLLVVIWTVFAKAGMLRPARRKAPDEQESDS